MSPAVGQDVRRCPQTPRRLHQDVRRRPQISRWLHQDVRRCPRPSSWPSGRRGIERGRHECPDRRRRARSSRRASMLGREERTRPSQARFGKVDARGFEASTSHPCSMRSVAREIGSPVRRLPLRGPAASRRLDRLEAGGRERGVEALEFLRPQLRTDIAVGRGQLGVT